MGGEPRKATLLHIARAAHLFLYAHYVCHQLGGQIEVNNFPKLTSGGGGGGVGVDPQSPILTLALRHLAILWGYPDGGLVFLSFHFAPSLEAMEPFPNHIFHACTHAHTPSGWSHTKHGCKVETQTLVFAMLFELRIKIK